MIPCSNDSVLKKKPVFVILKRVVDNYDIEEKQMSEVISIVVPAYNEEESLPYFYRAIQEETPGFLSEGVSLELIFVDDGSKDGTLKVIKKLADQDPRVKYISFSRNFGKEAAIYAGLQNSTGDYAVLMDADLQDPPKYLMEMYHIIKEDDYDSVATRRVDRKGEPPIRSFFARRFYSLMNQISDTDMVDGARDYRLMKRQMVDAVLSMSEYNRFTKGIFGWVGFRTKWLEFENVERVAGETKWSFWKLFKYSLEGITAFSTFPLTLASWLGVFMCGVAAIAVLFIVIRAAIFGDPTAGWPSLACIIIFIGGVQLFCIGVLGQYLAKTYLETKKRPIYLTRETNCEAKKTE